MLLQDLAKVIRSKNAGPRCLTLDIMFANDADYQRALRSAVLRPEAISRLYGIPPGEIKVIDYPLGRAIKIVLPRLQTAGDPGDRDVYGAQQHAPLLGLDV
jgi:Domain of unknown function (DUF4387)